MIGKVLGNRYEIVEKIGGGGMSVVYKAKCNVLNRYVSIKILRSELISDDDFVEKFKQESLSAASLNHPNIVNIYDTGIEDNIYYIVMEYVKGQTLKEYISKKGNLSEDEALKISIQVAEGLKHAHANNVIHRDIKPQNIMITEEGIAKVADFGIARAASTSTIINTSNVIGSVHYFSPEQARGGYTDAKSDIYSLGVVMYEMLTGVVPYNADNHISVAMMHIQEEIVPPSKKLSYITVSEGFEEIVLKCMEKRQSYRYQNCTDLLSDLKKLKPGAANDVINSNYLSEIDSPTIVIPKIEVSSSTKNSDKKDNVGNENIKPSENSTAKNNGKTKFEDKNLEDDKDEKSSAFDSFFGIDKADESKTIDKEESKNLTNGFLDVFKNKGILTDIIFYKNKYLSISAAVIALIIASIIGFNSLQAMLYVPEIIVPNVVGENVNDGREIVQATDTGMLFSVKGEFYNEEYPKGVIYEQNVAAGELVKENFVLEVLVSKGIQQIEVPEITGLFNIEATTKLNDYDLIIGQVDSVYNEDVDAGKIISQEPEAGSMVEKDTVINYVISKGPEITYVAVPNLVGKTQEEAEQAILYAGLSVGRITEDYDEEHEIGIVIRQSYGWGVEVEEYSYVGFVVNTLEEEETTDGDPNDSIVDGEDTSTSDENSETGSTEEGDQTGENTDSTGEGDQESEDAGSNESSETDSTEDSIVTEASVEISVPLPSDVDEAVISVFRVTSSGEEKVFEETVRISGGATSHLVTVTGSGTQEFSVYVDGTHKGNTEIKFN